MAHSHSSAFDFEDSFFWGGGLGGRRSEGGGGSSLSSKPKVSDYYPFDEEKNEKDPEEGHRWVKQAEAEFKVLVVLHSQLVACSGYGYVCFMAHQVAEKALKGAIYALCRRSSIDHNLSRHAHALQSVNPEKTDGLVDHSIPLEGHYLKTCYPNQWPEHVDPPFVHYGQADADKAKVHAQAVLDIMKTIMPPIEKDYCKLKASWTSAFFSIIFCIISYP